MWPLIDVLKLDAEFRTEKSAFRAIPNSAELNEIVEQLIDELHISNRSFARKMGVNVVSVQAWCGHRIPKQHPIPLWVLDKLVSMTGDDTELRVRINSLIDKVRCGRVGHIYTVPKMLTPQLSAFIGAHVADGCVSKIPGSISLDWQLADEERGNVEMCKQWIKKSFDIDLPIKKCRNANVWMIRTRIQIIPRFLVTICDACW
jgi:hypothetical protein